MQANTPFLNQPGERHTHTLTIPNTSFIAFVSSHEAAEKLAFKLSKTTTGRVGKQKIYAQPVITELVKEDGGQIAA